jgi:hypothetical protein
MNNEKLVELLEQHLETCDTLEKLNEFRETLENAEACCDDQEVEIEGDELDDESDDYEDRGDGEITY